MRLKSVKWLAWIAVFVLASACMPLPAEAGEPPVACHWNGFSYDCLAAISDPGTPAKTAPAGEGLTAGPKSCSIDKKPVQCSNKYGTFSNTAACSGYVKLAKTQDPAPTGQLDGSGAWYECTFTCAIQGPADGCPEGVAALVFWSTTPPAGIQQYTPAQAAAALSRTFRLTTINIGMAPARKTHADDPPGTGPYRRTWVGVPVWLWVANPKPLNYGPYSQTATLGGVTVTARAAVTQVTWSSGEGDDTTCTVGTPFDPNASANEPVADSPTCGFRFQHASAEQPGGVWNVTATSHWTVSWSGGGQTGTLQLTNLTSTAPVRVGELQSVNLPNTNEPIEGSR